MKLRVINNYPSKFQAPFPAKRANINGKLFFKYRLKFRNRTIAFEQFRLLVRARVENLLINNRPPAGYPTTAVFRMRRHNNENTRSHEGATASSVEIYITAIN